MANNDMRQFSGKRALLDICDSFRFMQSSALFGIEEKTRFSAICQRLQLVTLDGDIELFTNFLRLCHIKWAERVETGGILSLVNVPEILSTWDEIWKLLEVGAPVLDGHKVETLRNYLFFTASIASSKISPLSQANAVISPLLKDIPEWTTEIDDLVHQRYETQVGFILGKLKTDLSTFTDVGKDDALTFLEDMAPNVDTGDGQYQFLIKQKLYKLPHAMDIKAKFYFQQFQGNDVSRLLLASLLADQDLKREVYNILDSCSSITVSESAFGLLYQLIVRGSMASILFTCFKNSGLLPRQQGVSVPLRSRLQLSSLSKLKK